MTARAWLAVGSAIALAALGGALALCARADDDRFAGHPAAEERLRAAAAAQKLAWPLADVTILVEKAARRLTLRSRGKPLRAYKVGLGPSPSGHKAREGDGRTPEGEYYVCTRNEKSRFHLFLGLSYPAPRDADRGLAEGRIDAATAARVRAVKPPDAPPWDTPLGGEVGVHGRGASRDWTAGCVALEDADVDELWIACPLGTRVTLRP